MKRPKKPTYEQKRLISQSGLEVKEWFVKSDIGGVLTVVQRTTGEIRKLQRRL